MIDETELTKEQILKINYDWYCQIKQLMKDIEYGTQQGFFTKIGKFISKINKINEKTKKILNESKNIKMRKRYLVCYYEDFGDNDVCSVCLNSTKERTPCDHLLCMSCFLKNQQKCPICGEFLQEPNQICEMVMSERDILFKNHRWFYQIDLMKEILENKFELELFQQIGDFILIIIEIHQITNDILKESKKIKMQPWNDDSDDDDYGGDCDGDDYDGDDYDGDD